jgi:hypothetical protein
MSYDPNSASHQYPIALEELIGYNETADYKTSNELLLVFRDTKGGQVSFKLLHRKLGDLIDKLKLPPHPVSSTE